MEAINIVGGGIAGLALAAGLDPERHDVTVHEQRLTNLNVNFRPLDRPKTP